MERIYDRCPQSPHRSPIKNDHHLTNALVDSMSNGPLIPPSTSLHSLPGDFARYGAQLRILGNSTNQQLPVKLFLPCDPPRRTTTISLRGTASSISSPVRPTPVHQKPPLPPPSLPRYKLTPLWQASSLHSSSSNTVTSRVETSTSAAPSKHKTPAGMWTASGKRKSSICVSARRRYPANSASSTSGWRTPSITSSDGFVTDHDEDSDVDSVDCAAETSLPRHHPPVCHLRKKPAISPSLSTITNTNSKPGRRILVSHNVKTRTATSSTSHSVTRANAATVQLSRQKRPCLNGAGGQSSPDLDLDDEGSRTASSLATEDDDLVDEDDEEDGCLATLETEEVDTAVGCDEDVEVEQDDEEEEEREVVEGDKDHPLPAMIPSLFPHVPPVIRFVKEGDKVCKVDPEHRKLLKWRLSSITPVVVRRTIHRSGFSISTKNLPSEKLADKETHDWIGYFGQHMKATCFRTVKDYQKVNHLPGSFQIGRKDRLWVNMSRMKTLFGKKEFNFIPQTYCLPSDMKRFRRIWDEGGPKQKWIVKPPAGARGNGIRVIHKWSQLPKKRAVVAQKYLARPYLINGSKFDLRLYIYVTSFDPLRVYLCREGLARFATEEYSSSFRNLSNKFMHLTNYSVNKKNVAYRASSTPDSSTATGDKEKEEHKWTLAALWAYLDDKGEDTRFLWTRIKDLVVKTMCCADGHVNSLIKMHCTRRGCVHELFGFDVLLDEKLKPWLLEVNISPSLHSSSALDIHVKSDMVSSMFCLAGFQIPDRADVVPQSSLSAVSSSSSIAVAASDVVSSGTTSAACLPVNYGPADPITADKRLWDRPHTPDERAKHAFYTQRAAQHQVQQTILDVLTPDDIRLLVESVDESCRSGVFDRIFPLPGAEGSRYLRFLTQPRYYNLLLHAYYTRFTKDPAKGEALLRHLCSKQIHLQCPATHPAHQWSPPSGSSMSTASLSSALNALPGNSTTHSASTSKKGSTSVTPSRAESSCAAVASGSCGSSPFKSARIPSSSTCSPVRVPAAAAYLTTGHHDWTPIGSYASLQNVQAPTSMQYRLPSSSASDSPGKLAIVSPLMERKRTSSQSPKKESLSSGGCRQTELLVR